MVIWPHADTDWREQLTAVEEAYAALCAAITRHEPLVIVCRDRDVRERALARVAAVGVSRAAIATCLVDTDDTWARDIAPLTVLDGGLPVLVDPAFNGWGNRHPHARDTAFGHNLVDSAGFATLGYEPISLVLEGGAIDTDGAGTLLANRPTLVDPNRNPGMDGSTVEARLRTALGVQRILWLDVPALPGDDTDGHVDTLARFCDEETIAHAAPRSQDAPGAAALLQLSDQLAGLRTAQGKPYRLVPLPGPEPIADASGHWLPASYANFLVINDAVLVPAFADANDATAVEALQPLFPHRTILPVPARRFIEQGGSLHCLTMQLPEGVLEDLALT